MAPGRRAVDDQEKREILERLYALWTAKGNRFLRLGQLIGNVYHSTDRGGTTLYYEEDFPLLDILEAAYKPILASQGEIPVLPAPGRSSDDGQAD